MEIRDILVFHLGVEEARLADEARLVEDLGADSLDLVEIVMSCEEKFSVDIPTRAAARLATVGDAVRLVEARLAGLLAEVGDVSSRAPSSLPQRLRMAFHW